MFFFFTEGVKVTSLDRMEDDVFFLFTEPEMFNTSRSVKVPRAGGVSGTKLPASLLPVERRQEISCPKRNNRYNRYYCYRFREKKTSLVYVHFHEKCTTRESTCDTIITNRKAATLK